MQIRLEGREMRMGEFLREDELCFLIFFNFPECLKLFVLRKNVKALSCTSEDHKQRKA